MASKEAQSDLQMWKAGEELLARLSDKLDKELAGTAIHTVFGFFLRRVTESAHTLLTLSLQSQNPYGYDACTILRSAYDVYIQAAYILNNPQLAESRAQDFLDFYFVERQKLWEKVEKSKTELAQKLKASSLRAKAEPFLNTEYTRVLPKFTGRKGDVRKNWFPGDLRRLAIDSGLEDEYDFVVSNLSPSIHSSAYAMKSGAGVPPQHAFFFCVRVLFRILSLLVDKYHVSLTTDDRMMVDSFNGSIFDSPKGDSN